MKDILGIGNVISKLKSEMSGSMAGVDSSIEEILKKLNLQSSESNATQAEAMSEKLSRAMNLALSEVSAEELTLLGRVAKHHRYRTTFFNDYENFGDVLAKWWENKIPPAAYRSCCEAVQELYVDPDRRVQYGKAFPKVEWLVGFSHEFVKSIADVDKKKQGRILEAISKISSAPTSPIGDTIKPLTGDLAGLWRCRLGDDRLLYYPDAESKKVILISFTPRGDAYGSAA